MGLELGDSGLVGEEGEGVVVGEGGGVLGFEGVGEEEKFGVVGIEEGEGGGFWVEFGEGVLVVCDGEDIFGNGGLVGVNEGGGGEENGGGEGEGGEGGKE